MILKVRVNRPIKTNTVICFGFEINKITRYYKMTIRNIKENRLNDVAEYISVVASGGV